MKIEKAMQERLPVSRAHVSFGKRTLTFVSESPVDRQEVIKILTGLGQYTIEDEGTEKPRAVYSIFVWVILGALFIFLVFYLIQVLGMQDWAAPREFMLSNWYLVAPLIAGFATQAGLFRAIHLTAKHGGGGVMAGSGGVSGTSMLACCMHNLVPLFPVLGASGLATFFAAYQTQVFLLSILVTMIGVGYMTWKYITIKNACKTHQHS